jgi:hypothetical protein
MSLFTPIVPPSSFSTDQVVSFQDQRPFWKKFWFWMVFAGVVILLSSINVKEVPLGYNIDGGGYHLVTNLFGMKHITFIVQADCSGVLVCLDGEFKVKDADLNTFNVLNSLYASDKKSVYFGGPQSQNGVADSGTLSAIPDADASTFVVLDTYYAKDKNSVYVADRVLYGADPDDYKIIWREDEVLSLLTPMFERVRATAGDYKLSFSIPYNLAVSNNKLFLGDTLVKDGLRDGKYALESTLKEIFPCRNEQLYDISRPYQKSLQGYFCDLTDTGEDLSVEIDVSNFEVVSVLRDEEIYAKDSRYVYYINIDQCHSWNSSSRSSCDYLTVVEGADTTTFQANKQIVHDEYRDYLDGCPLQKTNERVSRQRGSDFFDGYCYYYDTKSNN